MWLWRKFISKGLNGLGAKYGDTLVYYKSTITGDKTAVIKPWELANFSYFSGLPFRSSGIVFTNLVNGRRLVYQLVHKWSH